MPALSRRCFCAKKENEISAILPGGSSPILAGLTEVAELQLRPANEKYSIEIAPEQAGAADNKVAASVNTQEKDGAKEAGKALVGVIMGSTSDWQTMEHAAKMLEALGVPYETRVVSAHRTPDLLFAYASSAEKRGIEVIIAGAGGAAHLPGMTASKTVLPVLGVPVESKALKGLDSLLSIAQMPGGIPVGTLAIGKAGAINAALLAAAMLGNKHSEIREALREFRETQTAKVLATPDLAAVATLIGSPSKNTAITSEALSFGATAPVVGAGGSGLKPRPPKGATVARNGSRETTGSAKAAKARKRKKRG